MEDNYTLKITIEEFDNGMSFKLDYDDAELDKALVFEKDDDFEKKIGNLFLENINNYMDGYLTSNIELEVKIIDKNKL